MENGKPQYLLTFCALNLVKAKIANSGHANCLTVQGCTQVLQGLGYDQACSNKNSVKYH